MRSADRVLPFFALIVIVMEGVFGGLLLTKTVDGPAQRLVIVGMIGLLVMLIGAVVTLAYLRPEVLEETHRPEPAETPKAEIDRVVTANKDVLGADSPPPAADVWDRSLRPVLHQVPQYSMPTYYLDVNLNVIDWNIAFGLIFTRILGRISGQHVNHFIAELQNRDEVFNHAREFTERVRNGELPLVDTEPLRYDSEDYGRVSLLKVACQLHDSSATLRGWAVGLMITDIPWDRFGSDLRDKLRREKLWSVYAVSYDRVLLGYSQYQRLIQDVIAAVPSRAGGCKVADLGAGTGNVSAALAHAGHRVTAVEDNNAMLERLRSKRFPNESVTVVKASVEHLGLLESESFDAVVMMNVLYAVDDPLGCLREVHRILRPDGVLALSTTHFETQLDPLLDDIRRELKQSGRFDALAADYERLHDANKDIEVTIARRYRRDEYREFLGSAGFEITRCVDSTYVGAVMVLHARKAAGEIAKIERAVA